MNQPPRDEHSHLVGLKMMIIAYCTVGVYETLVAFYSFYFQLGLYGFNWPNTVGSGLNYRDDYNTLSNERVEFFDAQCAANAVFQATGKDCGQDYVDFRKTALAKAQATFLITGKGEKGSPPRPSA